MGQYGRTNLALAGLVEHRLRDATESHVTHATAGIRGTRPSAFCDKTTMHHTLRPTPVAGRDAGANTGEHGEAGVLECTTLQ